MFLRESAVLARQLPGLLLLLLWLPATALAEEFGLDLTEPASAGEAPAAPEFGLDLSATSAPEQGPSSGEVPVGLSEGSSLDLRPTLALVGIDSPPGLDPDRAAHVKRLVDALSVGAERTGFFARIIPPSEAAEILGAGAAEAQRCSTAGCLAELADLLDVDRVVSAQYASSTKGPALELWGFDRGPQSILGVKVDAAANPGRGFDRAVAQSLLGLFRELSTELGTLEVTVNPPSALVTLNRRILGFGSQKRAVPAGAYRLSVTADGWESFATPVAVSPKGTQTVAANLVAIAPAFVESPPLDEPPATERASRPLWKRPGLYLALAGVVAAGTGAAFGLRAKALEEQGVDSAGIGVLGITRAQMLTARRDAMLANVLVGAGAALATGGAIWMLVEPATPAKGARDAEPAVAWLGLRGSF